MTARSPAGLRSAREAIVCRQEDSEEDERELLRDPARLPDWMPPEAVEEMSVWVEPGHADD